MTFVVPKPEMPENTDKRVQKTRQILHTAFFSLVLERRYEEIRIADILKRAEVGRSTFYQHFKNKDAILASSLSGPFSVLADSWRQTDNSQRLTALFEHFWANRSLARGILLGTGRRRTTALLVGMIEERFHSDGIGRRGNLLVPHRLAATVLAESLLGPLAAWLTGESGCHAERLALTLRRTGLAIVATMTNRI